MAAGQSTRAPALRSMGLYSRRCAHASVDRPPTAPAHPTVVTLGPAASDGCCLHLAQVAINYASLSNATYSRSMGLCYRRCAHASADRLFTAPAPSVVVIFGPTASELLPSIYGSVQLCKRRLGGDRMEAHPPPLQLSAIKTRRHHEPAESTACYARAPRHARARAHACRPITLPLAGHLCSTASATRSCPTGPGTNWSRLSVLRRG